MINFLVYDMGWLLYVAAQAQNSVSSKTNSLVGWLGMRTWLRHNAVNLATRAFFSGLAYGFLIHSLTAKMQSVGFAITSTTVAGVAGYSANALLYQFLGLFPGLRVEMSDLAPPANAQIVPTGTQPPSTEGSHL